MDTADYQDVAASLKPLMAAYSSESESMKYRKLYGNYLKLTLEDFYGVVSAVKDYSLVSSSNDLRIPGNVRRFEYLIRQAIELCKKCSRGVLYHYLNHTTVGLELKSLCADIEKCQIDFSSAIGNSGVLSDRKDSLERLWAAEKLANHEDQQISKEVETKIGGSSVDLTTKEIICKLFVQGEMTKEKLMEFQRDMKDEIGETQEDYIRLMENLLSDKTSDVRTVPAEYLCPLSKKIMEDPVVLAETGHTYDRGAISKWIMDGNFTDPKTGTTLNSLRIIPVHCLKIALQNYAKKSEKEKEAKGNGQKGTADALFRMGQCYEKGDGVTKDDMEAMYWYSLAAKQGHELANTTLVNLSNSLYNTIKESKDILEVASAVKVLEQTAMKGMDSCQHNLALCYLYGHGVEKNDKIAFDWFSKASEQKLPSSEYFLGYCYENGRGVVEDMKKAMDCYSQAAGHGNASAQNRLGIMYEQGKKVGADKKKAVEYYLRAAKQGNADAQAAMGRCYFSGMGVDVNYKQAAEWYSKADAQGQAGIQYTLAYCYEVGFHDMSKAVEFYKKAAMQGNDSAQNKLGTLYKTGKGVPVNLALSVVFDDTGDTLRSLFGMNE